MDIIELRRIEALAIPQIQSLLKRAVESDVLLTPHGFDSVAKDLIDFVKEPSMFMLLGAEKGEFKSVLLGYYPTGNLFPYPTVVLLYNEGSRALSRATRTKLMDICVAAGYTRVLAVNSSGREDAVWRRGSTPEGATSRFVGSLALFEVA